MSNLFINRGIKVEFKMTKLHCYVFFNVILWDCNFQKVAYWLTSSFEIKVLLQNIENDLDWESTKEEQDKYFVDLVFMTSCVVFSNQSQITKFLNLSMYYVTLTKLTERWQMAKLLMFVRSCQLLLISYCNYAFLH